MGREKNHSTIPFSKADKRAAIELWRAKVPLKNIRRQVKMSERTHGGLEEGDCETLDHEDVG